MNVNNEKAKRQLQSGWLRVQTDLLVAGETTREAVFYSYNCQRSRRVCVKDGDLCTLTVQQVVYTHHTLILVLMKSPLTLTYCSRMREVAMYQLSYSQSRSLTPMTDLY